MPIRGLFKKKEEEEEPKDGGTPQITFLRTTTNLQEEIAPPDYPGDTPSSSSKRRSHGLFHRRESPSAKPSIAERFRSRSRGSSASSVNLPANLPEEPSAAARGEDDQAEWEKRATLLVDGKAISRSSSPNRPASSRGVSDAPSDVFLSIFSLKED
jgi:hypothetical protein